MNKIKLGVVLISSGWSGAENAVYELMKEIKNRKIEKQLYLNTEIKGYYSNLKKVKIFDIGNLKSKNNFGWVNSIIKLRYNLKKKIEEERPDLGILFLINSSLIYNPIYKKLKIPFIQTLRGGEIRKELKESNFFIKYNIRKSLENSSKIISVSEKEILELDKKNLKKTKVINNGIDSHTFNMNKIKKSNKDILFVGRFVEQKGIKELLRVAKRNLQYRFLFVGEGPLKSIIKGENILNLGKKNKKELIDLYNKTTICVFPSYYEGFSNVGLEASSCGCSIIASKEGFEEYLEDKKDSLLIPAKDEKALNDAIIKLMENPKLRARLGKAARKKAEQYSWDKVADQYIEVFKEVINKS